MMQNRGFTLVEMIVSVVIASFLVIVALIFVKHEIQLMGFSQQTLELTHASRVSLDMLADDIRMAGSGIGYNEADEFVGIELGVFNRGTAQFNSHNQQTDLLGGPSTTDDIGIILANSEYSSIASFNKGGTGQLCETEGQWTSGETILLRSEDGLSARTVQLTDIGPPGPCVDATCVKGCRNFTWVDDPSYLSGPDAKNVSYTGGEASSNFRRVTYFVDTAGGSPNRGFLRRSEGDCIARDASCGQLMAENFESIQMRLFQYQNGNWIDLTGTGARPNGKDRLRVDLEIVLRSRTQSPGPQPAMTSDLEANTCFPNCGTTDKFRRRVMRMSVEVKNAGRLHYRRAGSI